MPENLSSFKNKYVGKRIFLVGNGPSLAKTPLDLLQGEYTMAMNRINLIYDKTIWRPTFFWATTDDIRNIPEFRYDVLKTIELGITTFAWDRLRDCLGNHDNVHYLKCHLDYNHGLPDSSPLDWWSDDITEGVYKFGTSMLPAMQVILYMGFDTIYLLGSDLGYSDSLMYKALTHHKVRSLSKRLHVDRMRLKVLARNFDKNHFSTSYGSGQARKAEVINHRMIGAHGAIKAVAKQRGVKVFNASLGGNLEVYPRKNFLDLVQSK
jgi:hypothetical protein